MHRIDILDIIEQEIEGVSLVDASRLSRRIMALHSIAIQGAEDKARNSTEDSTDSFLLHGLKWSYEIDRLIRENNGKIPAIKEVRRINSPTATGASLPLLDAKNAVEARERQISY